MQFSKTLVRLSALPVLFMALLLLGACGKQTSNAGATTAATPARFNSVDISGIDYAQNFQLPDTEGKVRTLADFAGKTVVVFFGFTHCPDVCPTTLAELREAKRLLGAEGDALQGIFISLDPERDSADMLRNYVRAFDPSFIALRGTPEQTAQAAKDFRIFFEKVKGATPETYTINHTAAAYVFDAQGKPRLYTRYGQGAEKLAADIRALR